MPTVTTTVALDTDDGFVNFGQFDNEGDVSLGTNFGDTAQRTFLRFAGLALPKAAVISAATLTVTRVYAQGGLAVRVRAAAVDNPAAPASVAAVDGLSLTTAQSAVWSETAAAWNAGGTTAAPSLTAVVQEIVNRSGWASGNALMLIVTDAGSTGDGFFLAGGAPATPATLAVTYTVPASVGGWQLGSIAM